MSTVYLTLKPVQDIFLELWEKLEIRVEIERIQNIVLDLLSFLVTFFETLYNVQREMECDKYTTIILVCLWLEKLKRHCKPSTTDSPQQAFVCERHAEFIMQNMQKNAS